MPSRDTVGTPDFTVAFVLIGSFLRSAVRCSLGFTEILSMNSGEPARRAFVFVFAGAFAVRRVLEQLAATAPKARIRMRFFNNDDLILGSEGSARF